MSIARVVGLACAVTGLAAVVGCRGEPIGPLLPPGSPTDVDAIAPAAPENVLSAHVSFSTTTTPDSVRVSFQETGGSPLATPYRAGKLGPDTIDLLALKAGTTYQYQVEAFTGGVLRTSPVSTFKTAALPADLADIQMQKISGSTSRYAVTGVQTESGGYAVAFDPSGAIVWYHDFTSTGLQVSDVMMQPNGNFTAFIGNTSGFQPLEGYYVEFTPGGKEVHTYRAAAGYYMDDHEIKLTGEGTEKKAHYITFSIETRDLSDIGGLSAVATAGHQIVRENASGSVEFSWDAWDRIGVDEWVGDDNAKQTRTATDFDHPNAISFDGNGNYIVSWRNLDQIMAIEPQTGSILWRVGGAEGQYEFVNDPEGGFRKQHSPKILANGNLLVYDNGTGHDPQETRAVEYKLDHSAHTATLVWEYRHVPAIYTGFVGWVERLKNGSTWVGFSLAGRAVEVDPAGNVTWESQLRINGLDGSVYRLLPVASLYSYTAP